MAGRKRLATLCKHCIARKIKGFCKCSRHCKNHKFISRTEEQRIERTLNKRNLDTFKIQRPKVTYVD